MTLADERQPPLLEGPAVPHRGEASMVPPGRRGGFSLPELLVVMTVLGLLAYVAVPKIEVTRFQMDAAARGTMAALVSAQRLAVKRQHDVVVRFDAAHRRLLVHQDRDNDGEVGPDEPVRAVVLEEDVVFGRGEAPWIADDAAVVSFTEQQQGLPALRFIRNGSASEEGAFYLTSSRAERVGRFPQDTRVIRVDRATGRVTWYEYDPPVWVEGF